jgi:amphi-Trp domain-containing protein
VSDAIFRYEGLQDASDVTAYFEALRDGFAKGALSLSQGEQQLLLTPQGMVTVTVEAKRKDDDCKIKFSVRWKDRSGENDAKAPLSIQALDPSDA